MSEGWRAVRRKATIGLLAVCAAGTVYALACGGGDGGAPAAPIDAQAPSDSESEEAAAAVLQDSSGPSLCEQADLDHSVAGCEYWVFSPYRGYEFECGAVTLSNLSDVDAEIELDYQGKALDVTKSLVLVVGAGPSMTYQPLATPSIPPGKSAVLSIFQGKIEGMQPAESCPSTAAASNVMVPAGLTPIDANIGSGFRIKSTAPVAAVFEHPYAFPGSDIVGATALRSVSNWGTRYRDVGNFEPGHTDTFYPTHKTWTAVVTRIGSTVSLYSTNGFVGPKVPAGGVLTLEQDDLFIGSVLTSSSPFAAWTSASGFTPYNWPGVENTYLQFAPVAEWGFEYAAVRHPARMQPEEDALWRIIADADGTTFTYDPARPQGAPSTLDAGQLAVFYTGMPFVVRSQDSSHRFHLSQTMTGFAYASANRGDASAWDAEATAAQPFGDPELESIPPPSEYANHYAFLTDVTFPTTYLVVIRKSDGSGFHDVKLDCAGTLTGWTAIGSSNYQYVYVALSRGVFQAQTYSGGVCDNGPHVADSSGAFSVAVWAWGDNPTDFTTLGVSFGYLVPGRTVSAPDPEAGPN